MDGKHFKHVLGMVFDASLFLHALSIKAFAVLHGTDLGFLGATFPL